MCSKPKIVTEGDQEVIKRAVQANADVQKASIQNRQNKRGLISENIRTSNTGIEDEINSTKKKLLGE